MRRPSKSRRSQEEDVALQQTILLDVHIGIRMSNQMEENMEVQMETGVRRQSWALKTGN